MSKYRNIPTIIDGIRFASKKEAERYQILRILEKSGEIKNLTHHRSWILEVNGQKICSYESDFDYESKGLMQMKDGKLHNAFIVEDVKSEATRKLPVYRLKKKLMLAVHGIEIREV